MGDRVVVVGASGFIGTRMVRLFQQRGDSVCAVDILPPRARLEDVDYVTADVRHPLSPDIAKDAVRIYNLAAVHRTPGHPSEEYYGTNVFGALQVTRLAQAAGVRTIVFTSSISVYGPSEDVLDEASPLKPASDYGRSKRMAELVHEQWAQADSRRQLVVVRPGVVFGPGERGNYSHLARALRRGVFAYPGRKDAIKSGGYVDELLNTIDFAVAKAEPYILYNFAFPDPSTTEDIVQTFGRVMGRTRSPPTIPLGSMLAAALMFELAAKVGLRSPIHRERVLKLVNSTKISPGWLIDAGYAFDSNLERALTSWRNETAGSFA